MPQISRVTVAVIVGILLCFAEVYAQHPSKLPRVGMLWPGDVERWNAAFLESLREHRYIDRKTAVFDIKATGGDLGSGAPMAEALVAGNPDVIFVAPGALAKLVIEAVNKSQQRTPVVVLTWDPVAEGLVDSAARPSGNVTGVAGVWHSPEFMTKHLQLVKDLIPQLSRVLYISDTVWYRREDLLKTREAVEKGGETMGVLVTSVGVQKPEQVDQIFAEAIRSNANAVIVQASPMFSGQRSRIIALAAKYRLPAVYGDELFAFDGGLMSYGTGVADLHRRAAAMVARILAGTKPAEIPVEYPTRLRLVVNLRTAKALGLTIPEPVLLQADEIIR